MKNRRGNGSIPISEKHGVNPCIPVCWMCGSPKNEVALLGRLPDDAEAPQYAKLPGDREPCDTCKVRMETHVFLMVQGTEKDYKTGETIMPEDAKHAWGLWTDHSVIRRLIKPPEMAERIIRTGAAFVSQEFADQTGMTDIMKRAEAEHPGAAEVTFRPPDEGAESPPEESDGA